MTWGDAMKDIKEKPTAHMPRSNAAGKIPKAALKKTWTEAKEKRQPKLLKSASTQGDGDYTAANETGGMLADTSYSAIKQNTNFTVEQGRKIARQQIEKYRERRSTEQTETTRARNANERGVSQKQAGRGTLPDSAQRPRRGAARCPIRRNARAVGRICPGRGQKKKPSPPRPHHEIFVV